MKTINEYKRMTLADQVLMPALLAVVLGLSGCQQEGTAEKAGQKIDRTVEKGEQKIERSRIDATERIDDAKGSLGQQADRATDRASDYIEESTQASKEALRKAEEEFEQTTEAAGQELERAKEAAVDKAQTAGEYIDDSVITLNVKAALVNDPMLQASQIEVTTVNGIVKLSGTVGSPQDIDRALKLAVDQQNVKSVQSELVIRTTPSAK